MSQVPYAPGPAGPAPWQGPPSSGGPSRLPTIIAIVIAVIAIAVAVGAWFRPAPKPETPAAKTYSEQEVAQAKNAVCDAYTRTDRAVQAAGRRNGGDDQTAILAVAVNIRLALSESSSFLLRTLAENPAAPRDLQEQIRLAATAYQDVAIDQLGEASQEELAPLFKQADSTDVAIKQACK
ncbi:putative alanine and proline rich membrane protein [uncultured Mycobacterium sp.]|uniref:Putative alanine and proline rich membrane protein n=1 Tax=uncultured Mycobacterium sp. TaxID=171292 RepID=A0A1Y5PM40_9MYCO|nr:putative alanine and proline rich membrane protein [uncultured Mycobacterium sp.]